MSKGFRCAYCEMVFAEDNFFWIHRDGPSKGPQMPLCYECGKVPTCEEIWAKIANPDPLVEAIKKVYEQ